jgi:hypothetical protein
LVIPILAYFKSLLAVNFSEKGIEAREKEEACFIYFLDFLEECEGNLGSIIGNIANNY